MKNTSKSSLSKSYGEFLEKTNWTYYCTLTTSYPLTVNTARKSIERFHESLKINFKIDNEIFWIAEPFESKYGYHIHALIKLNCHFSNESKKTLNRSWQIVTKGGYGKLYNKTIFEPYKAMLGGNYYVTKLIDRNNVEYGFL
jgi:hypothetical protein